MNDFGALRSHLLAKSSIRYPLSHFLFLFEFPVRLVAFCSFPAMSADNEKSAAVADVQPQPQYSTEKTEQVHTVTESSEQTSQSQDQEAQQEQQPTQSRAARLFAYMKTRDFWLVLLLG